MASRDRWEEGDWIFTTWKGNTTGGHKIGHHLEPRHILTWLTRLLKENGLDHLPVHGLRHRFATLALSHSATVKDVQEVLGHSRPSVTLDVYWQAAEGASSRVAGKIGEVLFTPNPAKSDPDNPESLPDQGRVS